MKKGKIAENTKQNYKSGLIIKILEKIKKNFEKKKKKMKTEKWKNCGKHKKIKNPEIF